MMYLTVPVHCLCSDNIVATIQSTEKIHINSFYAIGSTTIKILH